VSIASIVCVDGELDVHDTAAAAVLAAIERRREAPEARIGVAAGDLEVGDPLGFAKRLSELAVPGSILVSNTVRSAARDHRYVDLGAISATTSIDRIHVFELGGAVYRTRTVLALELIQDHVVGVASEQDARYGAELLDYDRRVWMIAFRHRGFVARTTASTHLLAFAEAQDAFRFAVAFDQEMSAVLLGLTRIGIATATMSYRADAWASPAWGVAERIGSTELRCIGSTMTSVDSVGGAPALRALGLVMEVVEEVTHKGVRDPIRVAQLRFI
jgi:class 3 adenylate cyclase